MVERKFNYISPIVITKNNASGISSLRTFFRGQFHMNDLGPLKYFLGIEEIIGKKDIFYLNKNMYLICCLDKKTMSQTNQLTYFGMLNYSTAYLFCKCCKSVYVFSYSRTNFTLFESCIWASDII